MAFCYDPRRIGVHPPSSQAECSDGLIRPTLGLQAVCVDGGMYAGARAFLEIDPNGYFIAHQLIAEKVGATVFFSGETQTKWVTRNLTLEMCV